MKKLGLVLAAVAMVAFVGSAMAVKPEEGTTGTGLPKVSNKGTFKLQVIAYDKDHCPAGDFEGSNRRQIVVAADFNAGDLGSNQGGTAQGSIIRNNTILLVPGDDFQVLDGSACAAADSTEKKAAAELQLPTDVSDTFVVFVRLVGAHDTGIGVTTCAVFEGFVICSSGNVIKLRFRGDVPKFTDETAALLFIQDVDVGGGNETISLFDGRAEDYFWQWNTKGKAHAQLVFIPIANLP